MLRPLGLEGLKDGGGQGGEGLRYACQMIGALPHDIPWGRLWSLLHISVYREGFKGHILVFPGDENQDRCSQSAGSSNHSQ